jgi:hypothetical protein
LHAAAFLEKPPDLDAIINAVREGWTEYQERIGIPPAPIGQEPEPPPDLEDVRRALAGSRRDPPPGSGHS